MNIYYLIDLERSVQSGNVYYWKSNRRGYTIHIHEAGLYSEDEANDLVASDFDKLTVMINQDKVNILIN